MPSTHVAITVPDGLLDDELDALVELLDETGLDAEIGPADVRMGNVLDTVTTAVITTPIAVLMTALTTAAGKRFWDLLTESLGRARKRDGATGEDAVALVIVDPETGVRAEVTWDALREAMLQDLLGPLESPSGEQAVVVVRWNGRTGRWERR